LSRVIPSKKNEDRDARPVEFDKEAYRRRIFSRFEKTAKNFAGMLTLAFIKQYLIYELI
jgi:hypothetical protein